MNNIKYGDICHDLMSLPSRVLIPTWKFCI